MHLTLAPLHGFTDATFRKTYFRHFEGLHDAIAPFISLTHGDKVTGLKVRDLLADRDSPVRIIPQILGNEPAEFILLCRYLANEFGYTEVNWNLGCPIHGIVNKQRGSGLLPYPERVDAFLGQVLPALPLQLSVKLRLGLSGVNEFPPILEVLNRYPLLNITIHPRIGTQMYEGEVLLDALDKFIPMIRHEWVYNGDIHSVESFEKISKRYPMLKQFMLGRGVFLNPFLPEMISTENEKLPHDWRQRFQVFHAELELNVKTAKHFWMSKMKEYWKYFGVFLELHPAELKKLLTTHDDETWKALTASYIQGSRKS